MTAAEKRRMVHGPIQVPAFFRHSGLDPESMFIGTKRRKTPG
jgi:hypothetical protein